MLAVAGTDAGVLAVGRRGGVYRWNGQVLERVTPPLSTTVELYDAALEPTGGVWAVRGGAGDDTLVRWLPGCGWRVVKTGFWHSNQWWFRSVGSQHGRVLVDNKLELP